MWRNVELFCELQQAFAFKPVLSLENWSTPNAESKSWNKCKNMRICSSVYFLKLKMVRSCQNRIVCYCVLVSLSLHFPIQNDMSKRNISIFDDVQACSCEKMMQIMFACLTSLAFELYVMHSLFWHHTQKVVRHLVLNKTNRTISNWISA